MKYVYCLTKEKERKEKYIYEEKERDVREELIEMSTR